jgi:hypothetical protein
VHRRQRPWSRLGLPRRVTHQRLIAIVLSPNAAPGDPPEERRLRCQEFEISPPTANDAHRSITTIAGWRRSHVLRSCCRGFGGSTRSQHPTSYADRGPEVAEPRSAATGAGHRLMAEGAITMRFLGNAFDHGAPRFARRATHSLFMAELVVGPMAGGRFRR